VEDSKAMFLRAGAPRQQVTSHVPNSFRRSHPEWACSVYFIAFLDVS